jgi:hypothetical protein
MMAEDAHRPLLEPAAQPQDAKLARNLPVISETFLNPRSTHLKNFNPWYTRLQEEYLGKILWDEGFFRVFAIQYNANKGKNVFPCREATMEPVYKGEDGTFFVHHRHQATMEDGTTILLKSAEVDFALADTALETTLSR